MYKGFLLWVAVLSLFFSTLLLHFPWTYLLKKPVELFFFFGKSVYFVSNIMIMWIIFIAESSSFHVQNFLFSEVIGFLDFLHNLEDFCLLLFFLSHLSELLEGKEDGVIFNYLFNKYILFFNFLAMLCGFYGILVPDQRLNIGLCQWEHRALTTGPPLNFLYLVILIWVLIFFFGDYTIKNGHIPKLQMLHN